MDNGRSMVATNEVAMTRASVATDFIMVLDAEEAVVVVVERSMDGKPSSFELKIMMCGG
jgi:hypothetical protein